MYKKLLISIAAASLLLLPLSGCNAQETTPGGSNLYGSIASDDNVDNSTTNSEDAMAGTTNELTISTLRESNFLEAAARRFEEIHEGRYTITINVYDDFASYSQIINTALMSGMGEDIIDATHITWQRLADVNMLVDLTNHIEFASGEFYQSVLDAFLHGGRRYVIPLNFAFTAFCFNFTDVVAYESRPSRLTLENIMTLAEIYPEYQLWLSGSGLGETSLAFMLFSLDFNEYIDLVNRQANIDNERFISMLENVYSLGESLRLDPPMGNALLIEDMLFGPAMSMNGLVDYTDMVLLTNDMGESLVTTIGFMPSINANSTNQELAARFITFLLSKEMQSSLELMFNPVNKAATTEMANLMLESVRAGGYAATDFDLENNITIFNRLAESLAISSTSDPFIGDFVRAEMTRFFDGEVTAPQAASNLQTRLTTYLNE